MTNDIRRPRRPAAALLLIGLLFAAGCQNVFSMVNPMGGGAGRGASASGERYRKSIRCVRGVPPAPFSGTSGLPGSQQAGYMARAAAMRHRTGWRKDFATRMKENGVEGAAAENVAYGAMDTEKLFSMWMSSKGHRRNMLDPRFAHYGLASAEDGQGRRYWALVLGR